ncbi:MAG: hypothetical protein M3Y72_27220, partial [Acidobacteriota bacterium]|nr:hypothetical protein [Acidobacteriota bacterium]
MPIKIGTLLIIASALCLGEPFRLTNVLVTSETPRTGTVFIGTAGDLPTGVDFKNEKLWNLVVQDRTTTTEKLLSIAAIIWSPNSHRFTIKFDPSELATLDLHELDWTATFNNRFQASAKATKATGVFSSANSKDDADLYVFGSYVAGFGTKPLYSIDAKVNWAPEVHESGYFFGIKSNILVNSGVDTSVDRTRVDPDSISAALSVQHRFGEFALDIDPLEGEFSRKFPATDLITAGTLKWVGPPVPLKRAAFVFYPFAGYEDGS